eukprot:scaffold88467_cov30-Phaeocystis_antarctica.AAC.1
MPDPVCRLPALARRRGLPLQEGDGRGRVYCLLGRVRRRQAAQAHQHPVDGAWRRRAQADARQADARHPAGQLRQEARERPGGPRCPRRGLQVGRRLQQ